MTMALAGQSSLDLGFLELDVLAHDRVIFAEGHLLGDVPRILLGHVEEAGVGGADELDLDRGRLGHDSLSEIDRDEKRKRRNRRLVPRSLCRAEARLSRVSACAAGPPATASLPHCM